jgi:hypothetical protein
MQKVELILCIYEAIYKPAVKGVAMERVNDAGRRFAVSSWSYVWSVYSTKRKLLKLSGKWKQMD